MSSASREREHNYTRNISRHKRIASFSRAWWLQGEWWLADFLRNNFKGTFEPASKECKYFYNVDAESHRGKEHTGKLSFLPTPWFLMWFLVSVGKMNTGDKFKTCGQPEEDPTVLHKIVFQNGSHCTARRENTHVLILVVKGRGKLISLEESHLQLCLNSFTN